MKQQKTNETKQKIQEIMEKNGVMNYLHALFLSKLCEIAQDSNIPILKMKENLPRAHAYILANDLVMLYLASLEFDQTLSCIYNERQNDDFQVNSKTSAFQELQVGNEIPIQELRNFRIQQPQEEIQKQHDLLRNKIQQLYSRTSRNQSQSPQKGRSPSHRKQSPAKNQPKQSPSNQQKMKREQNQPKQKPQHIPGVIPTNISNFDDYEEEEDDFDPPVPVKPLRPSKQTSNNKSTRKSPKRSNKQDEESPKLFKQIPNPLTIGAIPGRPRTKSTSDSDSIDFSAREKPAKNQGVTLQLPKNAGRQMNVFQFKPITTPPTSTTSTTQGSSFDNTIGDD